MYNPDKLAEYEHDIGTHYRKTVQYGKVYEVVRDDKPQKVMISVRDKIFDVEVENFKNLLIKFLKDSKNTVGNALPRITAYLDGNNTDFVLEDLYLPNVRAKEDFMESFYAHIQTTGGEWEIAVADKLVLKTPPWAGIKNARLYNIPSCKELIGGGRDLDSITRLISKAAETKTPVIVNLTIEQNVTNNNITNNINSHNKSKVIVKKAPVKKTIENFYKFICDNRPSWYKENSFVEFNIIESAYRTYFKDNSILGAVISRRLSGMFVESVRVGGGGVTKKKLISLSDLATLSE